MSHDRFTFQVPAKAARSRSELVQLAIALAAEAFRDRFNLRAPARDRWGNVIREPLHMFMMRHLSPSAARREAATKRAQANKEIEGRRADHFQAVLALWVTWLDCADHETWELREPDHALAQSSPHPTMLRLAELAELVPPGHGLADAPDRVWRVRRELEESGLLSFTKQWRQEKADGSHYSAGGALRRLSARALAAIGGPFGRAVLDRIAWTKAKRARKAQEAAEFKQQIDDLFEAQERPANFWPADTGVTSETVSVPSPEATAADAVHDRHPDWPWSRILAEARRLLREGARAGPELAGPPE